MRPEIRDNTDGALRVALDASPLRAGFTGVGRYVEQLVAHMPEEAVAWHFLTNRPVELEQILASHGSGSTPAHGTLRNNLLSAESIGGMVDAGWPKRPTAAWLQLAVPQLIRQSGAVLAHFPAGRAPARCAVPYVLTVHDLLLIDAPALCGLRDWLLWRPWLASSILRAAAVIAVSADTAFALARHFPSTEPRVHVILEAPADVFFLPVDASVRAALYRRYALGERYWLHVGAFTTRKNVECLIEAFARVCHQVSGPPPRLVLAGGQGDGTNALQHQIRRLGLESDVVHVGFVPNADLPALYSGAEMLIAPSLHEGFGLTVVEAMAAGTPVIASRRGALPEVVAGAALLLDDPEDGQALAEAMRALAEDPGRRRELANAGRERARQLSWSKVADETLAVYEGVGRVGARWGQVQGRDHAHALGRSPTSVLSRAE